MIFTESPSCVFEWTWRMKGYIIWNWLMEKLITQMLMKMLLVVTNIVFSEIIVWLHVDLQIWHTVTGWQATESTKMHVKISLSRTHIQCSFSWLYQHLHRPNVWQATELQSFHMNLASERLNVLSCIYMKEVEAWLVANLTTQMS